jgi:hypothetical protein
MGQADLPLLVTGLASAGACAIGIRQLGLSVLQAVIFMRMTPEDLSDPRLLGTGQHGAAIVPTGHAWAMRRQRGHDRADRLDGMLQSQRRPVLDG